MSLNKRWCLGSVLIVLSALRAFSQGCVPARFMALGLGSEGINYFESGEWQAAINYRFLYAEQGWIGGHVWPDYKTVTGNQITIHSIDLQATYAFTPRYSATFSLPIIYAQNSNFGEHDGVHRHTVAVYGVGDVRLVGTAWLLNPEEHRDGNISLGIGFKAPSGDEDAMGTYYKPTGPERRPVDLALQLGDGGWGIELEMSAFQKLYDRLYAYAAGNYLISSREQNKAYTTGPIYGAVRNLSVPDQYSGRLGLSYSIWPEQGLSLSFGGRIDGVTVRDLIGGDEGFRRPGFSIYADPGVSWNQGKNSLDLFTPVLITANRQKSVLDERYGGHQAGAFADMVVIARYARRF